MTSETVISTIRHGHTDFNAEKRYAGSLDISLNAKGIESSRQAAAKMVQANYDVVISSALKRAYETAQILTRPGTPILQSPLCNERRFGIMEGLTWEDVLHLDPPVLMINVGNDLHTVNPQNGEPFEDLWERARKFRRMIFRQFRGKKVLVVSHGVFLQMFHGVLTGSNCIESLAVYPANLQLTIFQFKGQQLRSKRIINLSDPGDVQF